MIQTKKVIFNKKLNYTPKQPTQVRLSIELMGPLRREFRFLNDVVSKYYSTVDRTVDVAYNAVGGPSLSFSSCLLSLLIVVFFN